MNYLYNLQCIYPRRTVLGILSRLGESKILSGNKFGPHRILVS